MLRVLKASEHCELISLLADVIEEAGYPPEEAIPALVAAIGGQAALLPSPDVALDEAAELLTEVEV
jgi:hypothetical protein